MIFIAIAALSLLLFAATLALWSRSESHVDMLAWQRWPVQWNLDCLGGEMQLSRTVRGRPPSWRERDGLRRSSITLYGRPEAQKQEGTTRLVRHWGGFAYVVDDADGFPQLSPHPSPRRLAIIPFWAIALLTGALPTFWFAKISIDRRRSPAAASANQALRRSQR